MLGEIELTLWPQKAQQNLKEAQLDRGPFLLRYGNMKCIIACPPSLSDLNLSQTTNLSKMKVNPNNQYKK